MDILPKPLHRLRIVTDADSQVDGRSVSKRHLVNRLNYINFQDRTILVNLRHSKYDNPVSLRVKPLPCAGEQLDCSWTETPGLRQVLKSYRFEYLLIPDGKKYLLVIPKVITMSEKGLSLLLPLTCREFKTRKTERHHCTGVDVEFTQHSALFHGNLVDFTPVSLRIEGGADLPQTFPWINSEASVNLHLSAGGKLLYSGDFGIIRQSCNRAANRTFVLGLVNSNIQRFKPKRFRNQRQRLAPSPNIVFDHPFTGKTINLKVVDLSGSGFSVEENEETSVLMPGMIIPALELGFAHSLNIHCMAQVVSRNIISPEGPVKCGLAILDMDIRDHVKLLSILHQAADSNSYICTDVDMDALWDFFFETGFIYPEKYAFFQANKNKIKKTYAKLYGQNPQIARHFIFQDRGAILGHVAMVRFYENSWLIHHHAARKNVSMRAGLTVLNQIGHYMNELQNLYFAHLQFVYCFFRPDNKFPNRVFGGFARRLHNQRGCSLDKFAYAHFRKAEGLDQVLPESWELVPSTPSDLTELSSFYRFISDGLMMDAFDVLTGDDGREALADEYRQLGFRKEQHYYSLRKDGSLKLLVMANITDAGFNMADLTNCATLIILDDDIPRPMVELALNQVAKLYEDDEMPVLIYPFAYVEKQSFPYEKIYMLWILNLLYSDDYYEFCDELFRGVKNNA